MQNKHELKAWLKKHNIDITSWGTGQAKTVQNLWEEVVAGDIILEKNPPLRKVHVVQVILRRDNRVLLEIEQVFADSRRRYRNTLPSEKMKLGERVATAVTRCLHEEFGLDQNAITHIARDHEVRECIEASPSYPGLPTHYTFYKVEAATTSLPEEDFWRTNDGAGTGHDPVQRHLWGWRERSR